MQLNRQLKTGDEILINICSYGDVPNTALDGTDVVQHFTKEAFQKLVDTWDGNDIRVDYDHQSEIADSTIAAGWVKDLYVDDEKGLMGTLVVSGIGSDSLNNLEYRYLSPAFVLDEDGTPLKLTSVALTNRPRLTDLPAVWNSSSEKADVLNGETADAEEDEALEVNTSVHSNEMDFDMEKLIQILGLPPEATEDDVCAAVQGMVDKLKSIAEEEAKAEAEAAEQKLEEEAIEAVDECGVEEEEDKKEMVNSYKKDPSVAKVFLNAMSKMKKSVVVNFSEARKPEVTDATDFEKKLQSLPGGQARVDFLLNYKLNK